MILIKILSCLKLRLIVTAFVTPDHNQLLIECLGVDTLVLDVDNCSALATIHLILLSALALYLHGGLDETRELLLDRTLGQPP